MSNSVAPPPSAFCRSSTELAAFDPSNSSSTAGSQRGAILEELASLRLWLGLLETTGMWGGYSGATASNGVEQGGSAHVVLHRTEADPTGGWGF
jgi:hypothetical protein